MSTTASGAMVDLLGEVLRRHTASQSHHDIQAKLAALAEGRLKPLAASTPFVAADGDIRNEAFPEHAIAAADLPADDVHARLTRFVDEIASQVLRGELPRVDLPDLHRSNAIYDDRGNVFLGHKVRPLLFDRKGSKAFVRLLLAMEVASKNLRTGISTTKRGFFYAQRASLPGGDQIDTDRALASLASVLRVRRKALGFVEARRGIVFGRMVLRDGGVVVDLSQAGREGHSVPRFIDDVEIVSSDASVILVVEKQAVAARLAQARCWDALRCICVCTEGFPSLSAREFVRTLVETLGIPALMFVDADPGGLQVALTIAHGSISTALETPWLASEKIRWAGLVPSDFDRHCGPRHMIRLNEAERLHARALLEHPSHSYVNDSVRQEVAILLERDVKVELDALCADVPRFLDFVREKLSNKVIAL
jgi:meiotic recombination protein SPO11